MQEYTSLFKYHLLFFVVIACNHFTYAQIHNTNWYLSDSSKAGIELSGDMMYQTNGILNEFTDQFIFGGFIDDEMKNNSLDRMNENNNFLGLRMKNGIKIYLSNISFFKSDRWAWMAGIHNQQTITGNVTKDIFELAFVGANPEETRNYRIKDSGFELISSNIVEAGVYDKKYGSSFTLSIHQAYNRINTRFNREADLFYSDQTILLQSDFLYQTSNPNENNMMALNGWGLTTDLNWVLPVKWNPENEEQLFKFSVINLGAYVWSGYSQETRIDTIYEYSGYTLDNSFKLPGFPNSLEDTLNAPTSEGHQFSWAPSIVSIGKIVNPNSEKSWQAFYGISLWTTQWNRPLVHAGVDYKIFQDFHAAAHLSYGGFGKLRGGLQIDYRINDHYHFWLGSQDIYGVISQMGTGRSINGGIRLWM